MDFHSTVPRGSVRGIPGLILVGLLLFSWGGCSSDQQSATGVQLVLSTAELAPTTTFELRFDAPVIATDQVGRQAAVSPLQITPPLPGTFQWLSTRSGVFQPEAAMTLDTVYRFTLRPGLTGPDAARIRAHLARTLRTPPLEAVHASYRRHATGDAPAEPLLHLQFNAAVNAADARPFLSFRSEEGLRLPAQARQGDGDDPFHLGSLPPFSWADQFAAAHPATTPSAPAPPPPEGTGLAFVYAHRLVVWPARPLPTGKRWTLVLAPGLPAASDALRLPQAQEFLVGDVRPFEVTQANAENIINQGRSIALQFSKPLATNLNAETIWRWLSVQPPATNLAAEVNETQVRLRGGFALHQPYTVTLQRGLPSAQPFQLAATWTNALAFDIIPPRLYFPAFSADQLAGGRREFRLMTLNVPAYRLRAKRLDRHNLVHALRGYGSYFKRHRGPHDWREPYSEVDFNVVPGQTLFQKEFTTATPTDVPETVTFRWDDLLGNQAHGAFFLCAEQAGDEPARRERPGTQALIQLTDLGLLWKHTADAAWVFVFSYATGQPVPGASVRLLTEDNDLLGEAVTDAEGQAALPGRGEPRYLLAEAGDDLHAVEFDSYRLGLHPHELPMAWRSDQDQLRVLLFSDRSVYRPGETVHLKAIARDWTQDGFQLPAGRQAVLRCFDARNRQLLETNLTFGALGSFALDLPLPIGVRGDYRATVQIDEFEAAHYFQVQDFAPNAFEIAITAKPSYAPDEAVVLPVTARYFLGRTLTRAEVRWTVHAADTGFTAKEFDEFWFCGNGLRDPEEANASSWMLHGEGAYSDQADFVLQPAIPINPAAPQPRTVTAFVQMTDLNQQTVSASTQFTQQSSEFYLGLKRFERVVRAGKALPLEALAVQPDSRRWPEPVNAELSLVEVKWHTTRLLGAGRVPGYRHERTQTNHFTQTVTLSPTATTLADAAPVLPPQAGDYLLVLKTRDPGGRAVVTVLPFYVSGPQELAWDYRNEVRVDLVPDQPRYLPGQTARILVKTPIAANALVTVERESVRRSFLTRLAGNAPVLEVPLETNDAPNVFVSVTILRGHEASPKQFKMPEYRYGYCQLVVDEPGRRLHVAVEPKSLDLQPGDPVEVSAHLRDAADQPVADAEVTLYAVDEGILSLAGYTNPDPAGFFLAPRLLSVRSGLSLPRLLTEDPDQLRFQNKGYLIGGGGHSDRIRKNFLACALWQASLCSDATGTVTARFTAPDSLTRYRIIAVAHTANHQFGSGETTLSISKPLMIEPALPRFANVTDELVARAVVLNQTDQAGDIAVTLAIDGTATSTSTTSPAPPTGPVLLTQRLPVGPRASAVVEFPVRFVQTGTARWTWRAQFADPSISAYTDAVESTLPVGHIAPLLTEIHLERVTAGGSNLLARANPQLLQGQGTVTVTVANTRLVELAPAVAHLLHYPYGCLEQTSSSLLPWLVLRHAPGLMPFLGRTQAELDDAIRAGLDRLFSMQTASGGLTYWPGGTEPTVWGSAYAAMIVALARQHGAPLPDPDAERLFQYLSESLRRGPAPQSQFEFGEHCLALYALALAGQPEPAYHERLFQMRARFSSQNRALLALAILESQGARDMVETLMNPALKAPPQTDDWWDSPARDLAMQLLLWTRFQPGESQVDTLVAELLRSQTEAHWGTTQGNAWALYALTAYAKSVEGPRQPAAGRITWGTESVPFTLGENAAAAEATFALTPELARLPLAVVPSNTHPVYVQTRIEARAAVSDQPRQDRGFNLQRRYARLLDPGEPPIDPDGLQVGETVVVTLELTAHEPAHYVAIDDPLPSLLEAVNPRFKSQAVPGTLTARPQPNHVQDLQPDFRELRNDRALFFRDHLHPGTYQVRYLARVRAAGSATAPPAKVEAMYRPDRFGLTEAQTLTSRAAK